MILNQLMIRGFRGFFEDQTLEIHPNVTVLTGANDTGKSTILDIIRWISGDIEFGEDDVNIDFDDKSSIPWQENIDIGVHATYTVLSDNDYLHQGVKSGWTVEFVCRLMHSDLVVANIQDAAGARIKPRNRHVVRRPRSIDLGTQNDVRTEIPFRDANKSEDKLLQLAFGDNYWDTLESLNRRNRNIRRDLANERLNNRLQDVKPESLTIEFSVDFESHDPLIISVGLRDQYGGRAWLPQRGEGYQKLIRLMFTLLTVDAKSDNVILIYDEPENSLHADAQRSFRRVLEAIADEPNFQVIYATHSPTMINASRPGRIRLLTREQKDDVALSKINNKPYSDEGYQMIRSSLGMSPADSLLYAPITVIIEGATESLGFDRLFKRLMEESGEEMYEDLDRLAGLVHFLGGGGTSFARWARMAHSQKSKVIVFVDGDQINQAKAVNRDFPDVPIVHFDQTREFENIVPRAVYFKALAEYAASNDADSTIEITEKAYVKWEQNHTFDPGFLFSKRVSKWYKELFDYGMEKAEVMDIAIKLANLDEIDMTKIDELIEAIREADQYL